MHTLNVGVLVVMLMVFFGIVGFLFYLGYRETKNAGDYAVAGGKMSGLIMGLSYGATFISTSAIVGFGGAAAFFGYSLLWLTFLNLSVGVLLAFLLFGSPIRRIGQRLGAMTLSSLLGARFNSRLIRWFTGIMIFVLMPMYTGAVLLGGARFLQEAMQMNFVLAILILAVIIGAFVIVGGLKGVMYTDAFTSIVTLVGMIALLFMSYSLSGGIIASHEALTALADKVPKALAQSGHQGWTAMPAWGSPFWYTVVTTIVLGVGIGVLAQPQLVLRFMTVKDKQAINRAILTGGVFIFFMTGTAFMVGPLTNLYFMKTSNQLAITAAKGNMDLIIPTFISSALPEWFLYLFTFCLIAAAVDTFHALIHVQGIAFSHDVVEVFSPGKGGIYWSRIGVAIGVIASVVLALVLPANVIARATAFWFGICAAGMLPALVAGLYWKRVTKLAAELSVLSGYLVAVFGFVFLHMAESKPFGIAKALFGKDALLSFPWTVLDPLIYSIAVSTVVLIVVSYISKPLPEDLVNKVFGTGTPSPVDKAGIIASR